MRKKHYLIIFIIIFIAAIIVDSWYLWQKSSSEEETCQDLCGDGICQEIVCLAIGCPCAETPESCPEDCQ